MQHKQIQNHFTSELFAKIRPQLTTGAYTQIWTAVSKYRENTIFDHQRGQLWYRIFIHIKELE